MSLHHKHKLVLKPFITSHFINIFLYDFSASIFFQYFFCKLRLSIIDGKYNIHTLLPVIILRTEQEYITPCPAAAQSIQQAAHHKLIQIFARKQTVPFLRVTQPIGQLLCCDTAIIHSTLYKPEKALIILSQHLRIFFIYHTLPPQIQTRLSLR